MFKAHDAVLPGGDAISQHCSSTPLRTDTLITLYVMRLAHNHTGGKYCGPFRIILPTFKNCTLLGYYAASSDNVLPLFWDSLSAPSSRVTLQDGTHTLSRNVRKHLPLLSA